MTKKIELMAFVTPIPSFIFVETLISIDLTVRSGCHMKRGMHLPRASIHVESIAYSSEPSSQFSRELYLGICSREWTPCLTAESINRCVSFFFFFLLLLWLDKLITFLLFFFKHLSQRLFSYNTSFFICGRSSAIMNRTVMENQATRTNWTHIESKDTKQTPSKTTGNKRSRITRACDICRRKKIKCDIDESQQCTTCKQYGWECTFNDTTKKRGPPKGYIESLETRLRNMEVLLEKMQPGDTPAAAIAAADQPPMKKKVKREISPSVEIPKSVEHSKVVRFLGSSSGYYLVRNILSTEEEDIDELQASRRRSSSVAATETDEHPGPLKFKRINVIDDDIMFVRDKTLEEHADQLETDKLDLNPAIAPKSLVSELIARFFRMDHASLPIIDKEPFIDAYEGRIQPPPATILIYAICTHTCVLLPTDDPIFKDAGLDRDDLFDTLVEHTTNLVKKEYLTPRLATIQALVLLCAYPACDKSFYRNWLRAGMAVRMAQELGLHRTLEKLPLTEDMFEARKRLWFCVYITDRWACAVMGRPLAIADADCDIELPHVNGGSQGTKDYSLFINFIKLSGILGEVLRRIYSPKARSQGYKNITTYHTVQSIHRMLTDWLEQLPDHQRITPHEAETLFKSKIKTNKIREAGPLMVCYHVVNILLYRNFMVEKLDVLPDLFDEASKRCTEAAKHAIDIARLLTPTQVVHFGWNFAGELFGPAECSKFLVR
ncbi:unnamed protein product [Mucor circinelloides]